MTFLVYHALAEGLAALMILILRLSVANLERSIQGMVFIRDLLLWSVGIEALPHFLRLFFVGVSLDEVALLDGVPARAACTFS
jgi:hypothetical protein